MVLDKYTVTRFDIFGELIRVNFLFLNFWFIVFLICAIGGADAGTFVDGYKRPILIFILGIVLGIFEIALCVGCSLLFYKIGHYALNISVIYAICIWLGYIVVGTLIELLIKYIIKHVQNRHADE